ncbi:MAG TPA: polysaccharide biosynthesis tyrosine autokinase [Jatrophihabitans sp.]|jgi:capsular exopolysaccharide synthesis family protein
MNARDYLRAIRKSRWLVIVCVLVGVVGGFLYSKAQTPLYACRLTFYVGSPALNGQDANATNQFAQDRAASYAALLSSDALATMIVDQHGIEMVPRQLAHEVVASAQLNTILIDVTITDSSPARATKIGNAVGQAFPHLVDKLDNTASAGGSAVSLRVVSGPHTGNAPVSPHTRTNIVLGLALGLLLGVGIAIGRELLDVSVREVDVIEETTDAPVIGTIAYDSTVRTQPLVVQDAAYSTRAESLRQIRTNLQFIDAAHPARVLVITSAVAGEGKSLVAINLCLVMAEAGRKVLIIEADMRRPRVSELLGLDNTIGLSTILANRADLDSAVQAWGDSSMDVLSSGQLPPNPSELLDSPRMERLIESVREGYELVIIDAPPVVPVTDASIIAAHVDGAIMVVRHGRTRRGHLRSAVASLEAVHARLLGCVVNMTSLSRADRRGYAAYLKGAPEQRTWRRLWRPANGQHASGTGWVPSTDRSTKTGRDRAATPAHTAKENGANGNGLDRGNLRASVEPSARGTRKARDPR